MQLRVEQALCRRGWSGGALSQQRPVKPNKRLRLAGVRRVALRIAFRSRRDVTDLIRSDGNSGSVTLCGTPRDPFAALDQRRRVNLNNALATQLVPDKSDAAILAWFSPIPWRSPAVVQFRDKGDEDSRADDQNYTLASRPADQPEGWACDREFS